MAFVKNKRNQSLGTIQEVHRIAHGIFSKTTLGNFRVLVYNDHTFRISITQDEHVEEFSYAVVNEPQVAEPNVQETDDKVVLTTAAITLEISKAPARFRFLTPEGEVINEDDPAFGTSWLGEQSSVYKKLQPGERFVGLGEKTGNLDRFGSGFTNWNTDYFGYPEEADAIYASFPFYLGIHSGLVYGVFMDSSYKTHFNFGASNNRFSSFTTEDGDMDYYFFHAPDVPSLLKAYADLTGFMPLPPRWSLGYQQCRYSYYPDKEVLTLAKTFRDKDIPADVIYLDIHYMDAYKVFSFDPKTFPDPKGMMDELQAQGFEVVVIADPGVKVEEGYGPHDDGVKDDVFVKYPDGEFYQGEVWPGWCYFPDFTKPATREWWGRHFKFYTDLGIKGFWNDMNEFATWGQRMPELMDFDWEGHGATSRRARNVYGMQMARSTYEGSKKLLNGERPFTLTRAAYCGAQRSTAIWTGDNVATDEHMLLGVRLVNSLGLTGMPYAGYDVGGFVGETGVELFARWISIGAFSPMFRGHSMINSRDGEPWSFGEEVEEISRNYIKLRYKLFPYIYSTFEEASRTALPICRSLAVNYPHDAHVYDERFQHQYLFGPSLLVCPVPSTQALSKVYLPEGSEWYNFHTGECHSGGQIIIAESPKETLPVFVKAGAIMPMMEPVASLREIGGTLKLHVYAIDGTSTYTYYEDDGKTYAHEGGDSLSRQITLDTNSLTLGEAEGTFASAFDKVEVVWHGFGDLAAVSANGETVALEEGHEQYLLPISKFDPMGAEASADKGEPVRRATFTHGTLKITW